MLLLLRPSKEVVLGGWLASGGGGNFVKEAVHEGRLQDAKELRNLIEKVFTPETPRQRAEVSQVQEAVSEFIKVVPEPLLPEVKKKLKGAFGAKKAGEVDPLVRQVLEIEQELQQYFVQLDEELLIIALIGGNT